MLKRRNLIAQSAVTGNVKQQVTMKEPLALALWAPYHRHGRAGTHILGNLCPLLRWRIDRVLLAVSSAVNSKIRAVQVHRMRRTAGVKPTPAHRLPDRVLKVLAPGPGFSIYRNDLFGSFEKLSGLQVFPPVTDYENMVLNLTSGRIDDEGPRKLRVERSTSKNGAILQAIPVKVCAGRTAFELHLARFTGFERKEVFGVAGPVMKSVDVDFLGELIAD